RPVYLSRAAGNLSERQPTSGGNDDAELVHQKREDVRRPSQRRQLQRESGQDLQRRCGPGKVGGRQEGREVRLVRRLDGSPAEEAGEGARNLGLLRLDEEQARRQAPQPLTSASSERVPRKRQREVHLAV